MNQEQTNEVNRRLNILNSKKVPVINKRSLREGMKNINQRREIGRYSRDIESQKADCLSKLIERPSNLMMSSFTEQSEPEVDLGIFREPNLRKTRRAGIGFWD